MWTVLRVFFSELEERVLQGSGVVLGMSSPLVSLELRVAPLLGWLFPCLGPGRPLGLHQRADVPWFVLDWAQQTPEPTGDHLVMREGFCVYFLHGQGGL